MRERWVPVLIVVAVGITLGVVAFSVLGPEIDGDNRGTVAVEIPATTSPKNEGKVPPPTEAPASTLPGTTTTTSTTLPQREPDTIPGWTVGQPWGSVEGVTMFRGSPTRTYYGSGPLSSSPAQVWRYPRTAMCSSSSVAGESKVWCGMGWTGQPVAYQREDGHVEVIFGAYDRSVHFVNGVTGEALRPKFETGDLIKGSVTLDPDGYPLIYFGSRDNLLRIVALDREEPEQLWSLNANAVNGIWNNDWDGNPVIIDDIMYEGGENGWFFAFELNREILGDGLANVDPELLFSMPGYNDELLAKSGRNVSIESSVVAFEQRIYFSNSGGRVVGLDVSNIRSGEAPIVFDYYAGGDIDATMIVDEEGFLYVSIEHEPSQMGTAERDRNLEVGQLIKLDPYTDGDPRVWGIDLTSGTSDSGIWATPALHQGVLYVNTHLGDLLAVDSGTGEVVWTDEVGWHSWSSPVVIDDTLVVATCLGELRGYSLTDPLAPNLSWSLQVSESCLEATPAVLGGTIFLGSRDGFIRAFR